MENICVLLSLVLIYIGVSTEEAITKYKNNNSVYIAATEGESEAADSLKILFEKINSDRNLKIYSGSSSNSHGTNMFSDQLLNLPLQDLVISWLANQCNSTLFTSPTVSLSSSRPCHIMKL
jgi:hypothetical protein